MSYRQAIVDGVVTLVPNGKRTNGHARPELMAYFNRPTKVAMSYDAARSGTDLDNHWAFADSLDADCSNSKAVRHTLMKRSRYEAGSNGYYDGIIKTHCNMLVGVGPTLRMLTGNRAFNQYVEREFYRWTQQTQLRRKLWAMCYARTADGESFALIQNNPALPEVQLDFLPIEAEQCQTPYLPTQERGYVDGIKRDAFGNVQWYDVLPYHPGSSQLSMTQEAVRVSPDAMLHWFKLKRPGSSRSTPECTSSLNVGASSRRFREAVVAAAETAADFAALLETTLPPDEADAVTPLSTIEIAKRMMMALPDNTKPYQMKAEHPNASYEAFHRQQISEQARPLSMPYNAAACDSSTYSFASGKLDTLCYRAALDVERADCNDLVLDPLFREWFREWRAIPDASTDRRLIVPNHQWDWPTHPVIDAVAEASSTNTKLLNGSTTLRQVYSDAGQDYEDQLSVMAEDWFGDSSEESIAKARQINLLRNIPQAAIQAVTAVLGLQVGPQQSTSPNTEVQA